MREYIKPSLDMVNIKHIKIMDGIKKIELNLDILSDLFDEDAGVDVGE